MSASVERLTSRLASTPPVFRGRAAGEDAVRIDAVVADLVRDRTPANLRGSIVGERK